MSDRRLMLETNAAKLLRSLLLEFEDDQLVADAIEGETNLREAIHGVLKNMFEDQILIAGIEDVISGLKTRQDRVEARAERRKEAIQKAMELGEIQKLEFPEATLSLRRVPAGLIVEKEADIPAQYWVPVDPRLDRNALKADLKSGKSVPGAHLDNGSGTISIKRS